ncbi:MAG: lactoylglutathione lyase [Planctomycetota bacterium]|nr:MAG: lactoylglutathione lyase [Planctomycetota bacterium]
MSINPVGWFEIYVQDINRSKKFYESVFDVKLDDISQPEIEMWCFPCEIDSKGATGALAKMEGIPSGGNSTVVYFNCEDCANESAKISNNGGTIQREKFSIGEHGFIALALDTEGNMIGLHSMK